ncbi:MAG: PhnD/SsuA/transferrin family substrate-binding protein [Actinomycetota bacterium]|nr:PhnD/SsuA/transferrin family substrate-binding protein [Actinomycetota bacterium]
MAEGIASLAMYSLAPLRPAAEALWRTVRANLGHGPSSLEWTVLTPEVWHHPDLLVAQACGWPLVHGLTEIAAVVGTFDYDVPGAERGTYRSVIISRDGTAIDELRARPAVTAAINSPDSLSGWVSLQHEWGGVPACVLETGSHLESVRALATGRADVASIDAVTWTHIQRLEPALAATVQQIGAGPRVPCLPLVVAGRLAAEVPAWRAAFAAAVADPGAAEACAILRIRGFVPLDLADYLPLRELLAAR